MGYKHGPEEGASVVLTGGGWGWEASQKGFQVVNATRVSCILNESIFPGGQGQSCKDREDLASSGRAK